MARSCPVIDRLRLAGLPRRRPTPSQGYRPIRETSSARNSTVSRRGCMYSSWQPSDVRLPQSFLISVEADRVPARGRSDIWVPAEISAALTASLFDVVASCLLHVPSRLLLLCSLSSFYF